jgi:hypothetical protein
MSTTESWLWVDEYHATTADRPTGVGAEGGGGGWDGGIRPPSPLRDGGRSLRRVCEGAAPDALPTETTRRLEEYGYGNYRRLDDRRRGRGDGARAALPTFLHHCQNYKLANHTFAKRKIPHDFFRCDGPPLAFDASALVRELDAIEDDADLSSNDRIRRARTGFMLCHIIPLMNMALIDYKRDLCGEEPR